MAIEAIKKYTLRMSMSMAALLDSLTEVKMGMYINPVAKYTTNEYLA